LFHIRAQNAALLLTGRRDDILVEAFDLLAPNKHVMSKGSLLREFPDCAAAIQRRTVLDPLFLDEFVEVLRRLELETSPLSRPKSSKSGQQFDETRDTDSPFLVTDKVIGTLQGLGRSIEPQRIAKRSREQVGWNQTLVPFHRSPTWLLLRVALRLVLDRDDSPSPYKALTTFHHAHLLEEAVRLGLESDIRFAMAAKVVRRLVKLHPQENPPWLRKVKDAITANQDELQQRWQRAQNHQVSPQSDRLAKLCFESDTMLRLQELSRHLSWIETRSLASQGATGPGDNSTFLPFPADKLPSHRALEEAKPFVLLELESWIELNLSSWVATRLLLDSDDSYTQAAEDIGGLQSLMSRYFTEASLAHLGNPDSLSLMFLNIMELWIALDKIAGKACPLLLEYDPGFDCNSFLIPLILPTRNQMTRLEEIETYIYDRSKTSPNGYPLAFANFGRRGSFAVRYFESSPEHRNLFDKIQDESDSNAARKVREYQTMRRKYVELSDRKASSTHTQVWCKYRKRMVCASSCEACQLQSEISGLKIDIFEWPLPTDRPLAQAIVFEIRVPEVVAIWRDVTADLFCNVFRDPDQLQGVDRLWFAADHSGLKAYDPRTSLVQLASTVKPVEASHYRANHISRVSEDQVCVRHRWRDYDYFYQRSLRIPHDQLSQKAQVPTKCSFAQHQHQEPMISWTRSAEHTSNQVIAAQSDCPAAMSLEAFRAFGHIRSGHRLQWPNVLCQLKAPSLDWNQEQTYWLVLQACLEAGPYSKFSPGFRKSHADLSNPKFVRSIVETLNASIRRSGENWQNNVAVSLLTCLATRVLSLTTSRPLVHSLLAFLSQARTVTIKWARQLLDRRASCNTEKDQKELDERALMAALTCTSTFDVKSDLLQDLLSSPEDLGALAEAAIIAHDNMPARRDALSPILLFLSHRWRRITHRSLSFVRNEAVERKNPGFHEAIHRFWADYSPSTTQWSSQSGTQAHILDGCMTRESGKPIRITLNILDYGLLVDGYPLSRLPQEYRSNRAYSQLFGTQVLEVMPSTRHGMRFSACRDQQGWVVHFALTKGDLVIQAVRATDESSVKGDPRAGACEFIPPWKLEGDVPASFIRNFSHWLDLSTGTIEFRPVNEPWTSSLDNWTMTRDSRRNILSRHGQYLIDPHSPSAEALSAYLNPIELTDNVDMIFHAATRTLVLDLPRFSISFSLAEGESSIRSKHYSGMCIDESQNIGALVGLQNKLVLKQAGVSAPCTPQRTVLVPRETLSSEIAGHHVRVRVDLSSALRIKHDAFTIDSTLGHITSSGSLSSKLYLCYLHSLTSHCLPDPLTGRTGTEEALRILQSASVRSFQRLDTESHALLHNIARLSPQRLFYPKHLQEMEQVKWSAKLPVLSQHDAFWPAVETILGHARDCETLHQTDGKRADSSRFASLERSSTFLVDRARIRNAMFRVSGFGAEDHTTGFDCRYFGRHRKHGTVSEAFTRAKMVAKAVVSGDEQLLERPSAWASQAILKATGNSFSGRPQVDLSFKLDYLQAPERSLKGLWCGLHKALCAEINKYRIAFFLSALVHAEDANWDIVQVLLAFANLYDVFQTRIAPPNEDQFNLEYKISSMRQRVDKIVEEHLHKFEKCPEANLRKEPHESESAASQRRYLMWKSQSSQMAQSFVSDLEDQWRQGWAVSTPTSENYRRYLDVDAIMAKARGALGLARRTSLFEKYLDSVLSELAKVALFSREEDDQGASNPEDRSASLLTRPAPRSRFVRSDVLFSRPAPSTDRPQPADFTHLCEEVKQTVGEENPLAGLFEHLSRLCGQKPYQIAYVDELKSSSGSEVSPRLQLKEGLVDLESIFEQHLLHCKQTAEKIRSQIDHALSTRSFIDHVAKDASLFPRVSPVFLLQHLSRAFWSKLSGPWREALVNYALSLAYLQRAERLLTAGRRHDRRSDLLKEMSNMGSHDSNEGDPLVFPESLLLELEQGIIIRPIQQTIAAKMREPPGGANSVMQLNMGEGKSSVIVPIVSAALADGGRLVRVVVAKPQANQMMHTLIATLGGLINRQIFYLPISRALQLTSLDVNVITRMLETCKKQGGVLLVQPEHLLSFKLMGLESTLAEGTGGENLGKQIVRTYRSLESMSRDIVDESDENFGVKFELIYTMGTQQPVDMSPERWTMIQEFIDVVLEVAERLTQGYEAGSMNGLLLEGNTAECRFPTLRVLEESAGKRLIEDVAEHVCRVGLKGFPIQHQSRQMRRAVLDYILQPNLGSQRIPAVETASAGFFSEPTTKNALLLLRGLLGKNVILFALSKRFRVNYGLAPHRHPPTMLAVPYRAKDCPAARSEFSHPDVVIALTCLSYYYHGLSNDELRTCLKKLSKSDQAEQEYNRWAAASPQLPPSLRHFSGVNLKDNALCKESIFPALRYAKPAIDFYLSTVVFPKEMREFPFKLSASGWDLGKKKPHALTGFSGTTDSKYVLPLSVTALDLPEQQHTNAAVLACLLRAENTVLELGGDQDHLSALTVHMLLTAVTSSSHPMRVILDVRAQVIDLSNLQMAQRWLSLVPAQEADAVIFFNDRDELSIVTRDSVVEPFLTSPFPTQTDRCLVFLDQAHTRGTDLKLPDHYRAAVTLGPSVTKDTLVQGMVFLINLALGFLAFSVRH
jgi:hypothetical protein